MRVVRLLACGLLVASVVLAIVSWNALPDVYPTRVSANGTVTATAERSLGWFLLSAMGVATFVLLQVIAAMIPRRPGLFNFPEKERFLALPPEHRGPVIEEMQLFMQLTALVIIITFGVIQVRIWRIALGHPAGIFAVLPYFTFLMTPALLFFVTRVSDATERAEKRWRASGGDATGALSASARGGAGFTGS